MFIAYYASAELGVFRALGWQKPANILDLFVEFRNRTNGLTTPAGAGLPGALTYFGLDPYIVTAKDELRLLALRGRPWSESERQVLSRLLCDGYHRARTVVAGNGATNRPAPRLAPWSVHGRRGCDGICRRADRCPNAQTVA